jgi:hypothetical protein
MKRAASLTLDVQNLTWLKGQAAAKPGGTLSGVVDRLVTEARLAGRTSAESMRSVVGSIDLPDDDQDLKQADRHIRALFERSLRRPMLVKERRARYRTRPRRRS